MAVRKSPHPERAHGHDDGAHVGAGTSGPSAVGNAGGHDSNVGGADGSSNR